MKAGGCSSSLTVDKEGEQVGGCLEKEGKETETREDEQCLIEWSEIVVFDKSLERGFNEVSETQMEVFLKCPIEVDHLLVVRGRQVGR